ncbi:chemotaxis protein [Alteribacillus bidgolensis]|uniref:Two-component system, chemotaxis family, response regulator CheV n=1 Tax=Alteribacillus bidgolensis TaxID=930129 RepID=A0A1G8D2S4_9BACI|nr:chemotaxis protein [Alteribacillus bidgolensis]SDH51981.1 two-component system, chemotaxis family, response regulator CheV [Alteribacillus bidgolensis]
MAVTNQSDILLESGTNELEIVMFNVGTGTFGINVLKVREILQPVEITETPNRHKHLEGIVRLREEVIPVIDLAKVLGYPPADQPEYDKFIIAELNQMKVAFHVHSVSRIHRISWEQIEKPGDLSQGHDANTIGIVKMDQGMSLLLDYEKIVMDIAPSSEMQGIQRNDEHVKDRAHKTLMIIEDSPILRKLLENTLEDAGYTSSVLYQDGKEAWDYISSLTETDGSDNKRLPDLIITDLEMPRMDGHHLTIKIKEHEELKHLPVVIFSSLITEDLYHKGERVGANAQVSKPEIGKLVDEIDKLILK